MSQISFADAVYAGKRKKTRRAVFLEENGTGGDVERAAQAGRTPFRCGRPRPQAVSAGIDAAGAPDAELFCAKEGLNKTDSRARRTHRVGA
jgi:hypothetical protein